MRDVRALRELDALGADEAHQVVDAGGVGEPRDARRAVRDERLVRRAHDRGGRPEGVVQIERHELGAERGRRGRRRARGGVARRRAGVRESARARARGGGGRGGGERGSRKCRGGRRDSDGTPGRARAGGARDAGGREEGARRERGARRARANAAARTRADAGESAIVVRPPRRRRAETPTTREDAAVPGDRARRATWRSDLLASDLLSSTRPRAAARAPPHRAMLRRVSSSALAPSAGLSARADARPGVATRAASRGAVARSSARALHVRPIVASATTARVARLPGSPSPGAVPPVRARALRAAASATMGGAAPGDDVPPPAAASAPSPRLYPHLDLDFAPRLGIPALFSCVLLSWGAVLAYAVSIVKFHVIYPTLTLKMLYIHVASFAVVGAAAFWVAKTLFCEARSRPDSSPRGRADADSLFADVDGVKVHYKRVAASLTRASSDAPLATPRRVVSCVHGFGANAYSWERAALGPLADRLGAFVVAHDAPGFGLTERSKDLRVYTPRANAGIARAMLDMLERESGAREEEAETSPAKEETETKAKTLTDAAAALAAGDADPSDVAPTRAKIDRPSGVPRPPRRAPSARRRRALHGRRLRGDGGGGGRRRRRRVGGARDFATGRAPAAASARRRPTTRSRSTLSRRSSARSFGSFACASRTSSRLCSRSRCASSFARASFGATVWRRRLVARASGTRRSDSSWADGYRRPSAVAGWDVGMVRVVLAAATGGVSGLAGVFRGRRTPERTIRPASRRRSRRRARGCSSCTEARTPSCRRGTARGSSGWFPARSSSSCRASGTCRTRRRRRGSSTRSRRS